MKKFFLFAAAALFLMLNSCENDFDVAADWEDIPVVYGLLSLQDTAHYIKVEKAFLDPDANALEIARIPDSLYYDNAMVMLERVSNGEIFTLERVDGNLEGYVREDGIFAESPNWLYKIDSAAINLQAGETIRLILDRGNGSPLVTAETVIQEPGAIRNPDPNFSVSFSFLYNTDTPVQWSSSPEASIFDVTLLIHYAEYRADNPDSIEEKTLEWKWARGRRFEFFSPQYTVEKQGREFYEILKNNLPADPNLTRLFTGIDLVIVSGGEELERYVDVALSNTGITGSQEIPSYSNLSEGLGIFSTINYLTRNNIGLQSNTRDSLRNGVITKDLNFN